MNKERTAMNHQGAILLDRDGVITRERPDYVKSISEIDFIEGALEGIRILSELTLPLGIITNQSVVGRGLISEQSLIEIHEYMLNEIRAAGGRIDGVFCCPHGPEDNCSCRKPSIGLFEKAARELGISLKASWFVGDKTIDEEAGRNAGCKTIRIPTNMPNALLRTANSILGYYREIRGTQLR